MDPVFTGKLIKRQRLPKNDVGDHYNWKDLNLGQNVTFYGKVFHLYDCDKWTRVCLFLCVNYRVLKIISEQLQLHIKSL